MLGGRLSNGDAEQGNLVTLGRSSQPSAGGLQISEGVNRRMQHTVNMPRVALAAGHTVDSSHRTGPTAAQETCYPTGSRLPPAR